MNQQQIICDWYYSLKIAKVLNLEVLRSTDTKEGYFFIRETIKTGEHSAKSKEIYRDEDITKEASFLRGVEYKLSIK